MSPDKIWNGVIVQEDGMISDAAARMVRKRLRVLITADTQKLALVLAELEKLQNGLSNLATMEFAVEDLTDPEKEL